MSIQILVSTMHQIDYAILGRMQIQSDAVIINQCNQEKKDRFDYHGHEIIWIDTRERGVSKSRNMALQYATSDICLLVDDDEILCDNYSEILINAFETIQKADVITFNIESIGNVRERYFNTRIKRLHLYNAFRYGAARLAFRNASVKSNGILMNEEFGPGCEISSGEDSIFIQECLRKGLKMYSWPETIAKIHDEESTWFTGYDNKYFLDRGRIFAAMSPAFSDLWICQYGIRHFQTTKAIGFWKAMKLMLRGKKDYLNKTSIS